MNFEHTYLRHHGVTVVLDVGANVGQTGKVLRKNGYEGRIVSFEPIAECHARLAAAAAEDPLWETFHTALGDRSGPARIGVSENLVSSSIREATDALVDIHTPIRYARHEDIPLARLDSLLDDILRPGDVTHLKIDTQGFERQVIEGAGPGLSRIGSVRMEVAVGEVYKGEMILPEAIDLMSGLGYVLIDAWPAWRHPRTDEVLHFDLLFRRRDVAPMVLRA